MTDGDLTGLLRREAGSLVERLRLWTPTRWAAAAPDGRTRSDVTRHLAQSFADAAADLEGEPRRGLPHLSSDLALPDQLAVTADDLVRAGPGATGARAALAHLLTHRTDLLGDAVPQALCARLGVPDETAVRALVASCYAG